MKKLALLVGAWALITNPAVAMTDAECKAAWTQADTNRDGTLSDTEANRYAASMRVANKPMPADGKFTDAVFLEHCKAGVFSTAAVEAGAPLAGANSFTENQAKDRAMAAGFTDVGSLSKDDNGVWRGKAKQGDKGLDIAIDYKGNVVGK